MFSAHCCARDGETFILERVTVCKNWCSVATLKTLATFALTVSSRWLNGQYCKYY